MPDARLVSILGSRTGAAANDCERALDEANQDLDRAVELLYERGQARRVRAAQAARALASALAKLPAGSARADALRNALGTDPYRAFDVASAMPKAKCFEGPLEHRRGVVIDAIAVLTDTSHTDMTPVLVMVVPSAEHASVTASNWVGTPAAPVPFGSVSKPARKRASKKTAASASASEPSTAPSIDGFAPPLLKQIARLKGVLPADFATRTTVETAVGPRSLSPVVSAFMRIAWPRDRKLVFGDPEAELTFGGYRIVEHLAKDHDGPLYGIAYDELQYHEVVRADDMEADPRVYRIDHDGSSPLDNPQLLSTFLAKIKTMSTAPAKGVGPELLEAIRDLDSKRAVDLVKRGGKQVLAAIDRSGFTPLHYAAMGGLADVVTALLEAGADPNATLGSQMKFGKKLRGNKWGASREPYPGETPLHSALFTDPKPVGPRDTLGVVRALLAAGADANKPDSLARTPLQIAARLPKADDPVVTVLLAAGADPNVDSEAIGSPLGNALLEGLDRVRALLAAGADPNRATKTTVWEVKGATAIHMAARWGLGDVLTVLLDGGGDPNARAGDGSLPLTHARGTAAEVLRARGAIAG